MVKRRREPASAPLRRAMTARIVWDEGCTGAYQDDVRAVMRGILTNLVRARLCYDCRKPLCGCRFTLKREPFRLDAELIRDRLPAALLIGGCAEDLFTPHTEKPWADVFRLRGDIEQGFEAHTKEHFLGMHPSGAPKIRQVISNPQKPAQALAAPRWLRPPDAILDPL